MKAIITRARLDGTYAEVGGSDRTVLSCKRENRLWKFARQYAGPRAFRLEIWDNPELFYAEPDRVEYGVKQSQPCHLTPAIA